MKAKQSNSIQFISSYPGNPASSDIQRKAHSHAARTAHAKARRLRTASYQAGKHKCRLQEDQGANALETMPSCGELAAVACFENAESALDYPLSLLAADRKDPFCSFAKSFDPIEHFLLDHCKRPFHSLSYRCRAASPFLPVGEISQPVPFRFTNISRRTSRNTIHEHRMQQDA